MPFRPIHINEELLFDFFLTFPRFEYALKACNFFQRLSPKSNECYKPPDAKPDWNRFASSLRGAFRADKNDELWQACEYILDSPPCRQVIINDEVACETPIRPEHESDIEFLLSFFACLVPSRPLKSSGRCHAWGDTLALSYWLSDFPALACPTRLLT